MPMPIDPRVAALRAGAGGPQMGQPPNPYLEGITQPIQPQSGLALAQQQRMPQQAPPPQPPAGGSPPLSAASAGLIAGAPQANEQFAQGQRAGDMADAMRQSSLEPVKGKMVGRVYVPASIFEGGAKIVQAFVARKKEQEQKEERSAAAKELSSLRADYARQFGTSEEPTDG